jgi:hypothetical protein
VLLAPVAPTVVAKVAPLKAVVAMARAVHAVLATTTAHVALLSKEHSTHLVLRISVGDGVCQRFRVLPALVLSGILLRVEYQRIRLT